MTGLSFKVFDKVSAERDGWIARALIRHRLLIVLAWMAAVAVFVPLASRLEESLMTTAAGAGGDSMAVTEMLTTRLGSPFAQSALLVATGIPDPGTPAGARLLNQIADAVSHVPGVAAISSYLNTGDAFFIGDDGAGTFLIAGLDTHADSVNATMQRLQQTTAALATELRSEAPAIRLLWTGEAALNRDIRAISQNEASAAELRALPLTLTILIVVFGSVAAAFIPLLAGTLAIPFALGAAMLLAGLWPMSALLVNVVTMIGLALSIDYSLLMMDRFREARATGCDSQQAAIESARHAGRTVLMSGLAVAIGFAALLAVPVDELRSVALGGLLATSTAVLLATTLLPGLLSWLGGTIEFGRLWSPRPARSARSRGWPRFVVANPVAVLLLAGLPVLALAAQAPRLQLELPRGEWLPRAAESARAIHALRDMGRGGVVDSIRIVLVTPPGVTVTDPAGWSALQRLTKNLTDNPRIMRVTSLAKLPGGGPLSPQAVDFLPGPLARALVSADRHVTLIEAVPSRRVESFEVSHLVRALRSASSQALTGLAGARVLIGGSPAFQVEYEDAVTGSFVAVVVLVLAGTLAALMVSFRSILIPVKAVLLNLLSVAAGFGAVVLVFQDGHGAALLGMASPPGAVFPVVPALVFCAVFGLSMDYEVFLVARVAELRRSVADERTAVAEALARTGRLITGGAAVMITVFAAFALGDFLLMKMLGFALAVTVLIDATVVRMAIGPALLSLAGSWNWWPGDGIRRAAALPQPIEAAVAPPADAPART